ncbi:precorrin-6A/cobalt-precorrin-6A reductase [Meinhardsimonia xiamenensis]|jgi:precorrin-6A/cobalt-precorrin-6A reductase|uniref:Precorrin-6A/cobalt-precorrin-6A reductase n=1 Tax=Meinhardsimonia xiamenensis TaxID=990712 RepID=A0A1G9D6W5_9RHOB|nr:cobalt-precorrin-6A reductase [Meinhardsimonia xiamenensis]PRX38109.1 precorrin-6A/cobalt-precorrin-6A reductase [Meinhardsimonia xiamenensis]SDK59617.1 precorrin-6A/cobalt-precorrin-6A reductase [Meinhardsimonia xiamenensis]
MRLLLLAGTGEARRIASALAEMPGLEPVASLAGATRGPARLAIPTRIGGFGGAEGFRAFLESEGIGAVLDATHPFAARISHRSAAISAEAAIPYLQLLRPPWLPRPDDNWLMARDAAEAVAAIPAGARVFVVTGRQTLEDFAGLDKCTVFFRQIDPPGRPFPFPQGDWVIGRPPFSVEDEEALFRRLRIDWLVVKNAGGRAAATKLEAARRLGVTVAMLRRPRQPAAPRVASVGAALDWVRRLAR